MVISRYWHNVMMGIEELLPHLPSSKPIRVRPVLTGNNASEALAANFVIIGKDMEHAIYEFERAEPRVKHIALYRASTTSDTATDR